MYILLGTFWYSLMWNPHLGIKALQKRKKNIDNDQKKKPKPKSTLNDRCPLKRRTIQLRKGI